MNQTLILNYLRKVNKVMTLIFSLFSITVGFFAVTSKSVSYSVIVAIFVAIASFTAVSGYKKDLNLLPHL